MGCGRLRYRLNDAGTWGSFGGLSHGFRAPNLSDLTRLDSARTDEPGLTGGTPLWYYLLKEAELVGRVGADGRCEPGEGLGPVGAQIVAEVVIGLIELDPRSWLGSNRNWRPMENGDHAGVMLDRVGHILSYR